MFLSQIPYVKRANEYRPGMLLATVFVMECSQCVAYYVFGPN